LKFVVWHISIAPENLLTPLTFYSFYFRRQYFKVNATKIPIVGLLIKITSQYLATIDPNCFIDIRDDI
jgi:hypothetical protein